ncbi:hypothetical protein [Saccharopolyspora mangrovi]|uniref:XRE family transcriptional regulator n=1 Tax=Saccharopolyspora mangrovi TaxID=3082379 RepID=A0ABU6A7L1_9PSEU|nr:hypothetical protein [Saccharopolyspora sp. S2-29]MEB3367365.1 hypothetical protein [Saccharopolyspora sp. S2-29]
MIDLTRYHSPSGESGPELLARAIEVRRTELGLNRKDISARGGPTHQTVFELERSKKNRVSARTLRNLETALMFQPGTLVDDVLVGRQPLYDQPAAARETGEHLPPIRRAVSAAQDKARVEDALYSLLLTMGREYGRGLVMEITARAMQDLASEGERHPEG